MCVATPMRIVAVEGSNATVDVSGIQVLVSIELVDDVAVGDYVIVHAGYAIQRLDPEDAQETLAIFERLKELAP